MDHDNVDTTESKPPAESADGPDLWTSVHKGIRRALFQTCMALGKVPDDHVPAALRAQLRSVLHFVRHHGENEDLLLLPMIADALPAVHARMRGAHAEIEAALRGLEDRVDHGRGTELYQRACELTARYLDHMRDEEEEFEPQIRATLCTEQLEGVGRGSVARTPLADARAMLGWMLPAMRPADARAFIGRLPPDLAREMRALLDSARRDDGLES